MFGSIKYFSVISLFPHSHRVCYVSDILKGLSFLVRGQSEKEANLKSGWDCSGVVRLPARRCHCGTRYCSGVAFEFPPSGPSGSMTVSNRETNPSREVQASLKQRWCCTMKDRREINKLHGSSLKIVAVLGSVWRQSFIRPFLIFCMCNFDAVVSVRLFISACSSQAVFPHELLTVAGESLSRVALETGNTLLLVREAGHMIITYSPHISHIHGVGPHGASAGRIMLHYMERCGSRKVQGWGVCVKNDL